MMSVIHDANGRGISSENPLSVKVTASDVQQPVDLQSRYQQSIQTHNAVSVTANSISWSAWIDTTGFENLAAVLKNDASTTSSIVVQWSADGVNAHGSESLTALPTSLFQQGVVPIKARYARIGASNGDTGAAHIMSTWAYLKA